MKITQICVRSPTSSRASSLSIVKKSLSLPSHSTPRVPPPPSPNLHLLQVRSNMQLHSSAFYQGCRGGQATRKKKTSPQLGSPPSLSFTWPLRAVSATDPGGPISPSLSLSLLSGSDILQHSEELANRVWGHGLEDEVVEEPLQQERLEDEVVHVQTPLAVKTDVKKSTEHNERKKKGGVRVGGWAGAGRRA